MKIRNKGQRSSDGTKIVKVGKGEEQPQELVDHLAEEFERERRLIWKAARKLRHR